MACLVVVLGWNAATRLSSDSIAAPGVTPLSCPNCPKSPQAFPGQAVGSSVAVPSPQEFRVLHFNTRAGAALWRAAHAEQLTDKVVLLDGDDD